MSLGSVEESMQKERLRHLVWFFTCFLDGRPSKPASLEGLHNWWQRLQAFLIRLVTPQGLLHSGRSYFWALGSLYPWQDAVQRGASAQSLALTCCFPCNRQLVIDWNKSLGQPGWRVFKAQERDVKGMWRLTYEERLKELPLLCLAR